MPRLLGQRGLSTFYIDESDDKKVFAIAFVRVPTLRIDADTSITWDEHLDGVKRWRSALYREHGVPISKELKGSKIATGRNRYWKGKLPIYGQDAFSLYSYALEQLSFLPDASIFSVVTTDPSYTLYGHTRLEAALYGGFQRIQRHCESERVSALVFTDEGHAEYRTIYRRACKFMLTGSNQGQWPEGGRSRNMPLSCAFKDLNFKKSETSHFVQIADLVAYATLLKMRSEANSLSDKERNLGFGSIHDHIPRRVLNAAVDRQTTDGIKRLR
jgi:hypothetical protein